MREAGKLLEDLPELWSKASLGEHRNVLMTMLEAVYVDAKYQKRIVGIKSKPAFKPIFQLAETIEGSWITLLKDKDKGKASGQSPDATDSNSSS